MIRINDNYLKLPGSYLFATIAAKAAAFRKELDNDDIISAVEQTPTYKRTREILASIGNQHVEETPSSSDEAVQGVISFA